MKPAPAPKVPGATPWERLDNAIRLVLTVPKESVVKAEARTKKLRPKKRAKKPGY